MIVVQTTLHVDPQRREEALAQVRALVEASRDVEGVRHYSAAEDLLESNAVRFFEVYEDAAVADTQENLPEKLRFVEALPELAEDDIESIQFETDDIHEVEYTAAEAVASLE